MGGERMYFVGGIMSGYVQGAGSVRGRGDNKNPPGSRRVMRSLYQGLFSFLRVTVDQ